MDGSFTTPASDPVAGELSAPPSCSEPVDVIIVGARCSGASLATLLARSGRSVALVEKADELRNILSSHIMQADSLRFLNRLGIMPDVLSTGAPAFVAADTRLEDFQQVLNFSRRPGDLGGGICVRRHVLDPILLDAARRAGVRPLLGTKVTDLLSCGGRVSGVRVISGGQPFEITAKLVVGADGRNSTVARLVGARKYHVTPSTRAYHWSYFSEANPAGPPTFVFHRWGDRFVLGAPADNGLYLVGTSHSLDQDKSCHHRTDQDFLDEANCCAPVATAITGARRVAKIFGIARFSGYFRESAGPGWLLLGDAGHFKDPAAGRGIGDAFRQVEALHTALESVLDAPATELDATIAGFANWRDRAFIEHYWVGCDLGRSGAISRILPEMVRRMHAQGRGAQLLDVLSHDVAPSQVLTPGRALGAVGRLLVTGTVSRCQVLKEFASVLADQVRRTRLARHPRYEHVVPAVPSTADRSLAGVP